MKIIKDNYTRTYRATCPKCKSVYEFTQDEVIEGDCIKIACPLCNEKIFLAPNKNEIFQNVTEVKKAEKKPAAKKTTAAKCLSQI